MLGLNLRVTGHCNQGGRKYMEDAFVVGYQQTKDEKDLEYAYFGIFDGHGGREAALYAKEHLLDAIVKQKNFWSNNDDDVLRAIKDGFIATHHGMWKEVGTWPKTMSGLPSTSGTTASIAFIRKKKLYIGHVGDSRIVLGYESPDGDCWIPESLTKDHKPESPAEKERIYSAGGLVMNKSGVDRVVWNRPRVGHKGPVRRSTHFDQIPFLAVARSLGDLWSYNYFRGAFVVSPEPDVCVVPLDSKRDRCIIIASDGLWNMIGTREAVRLVREAERENEGILLESGQSGSEGRPVQNPSKLLVDEALSLWSDYNARADNTSVVTVMLDPAGPSHREVLMRQKVLRKLRPRVELWDQDGASSPSQGSCDQPPGDAPAADTATERQPDFEMDTLPRPVILTPKRVTTNACVRTERHTPPDQPPEWPEQEKRPADSAAADTSLQEMQENQPGSTKRHSSPRSDSEPPQKLLRPQNGTEATSRPPALRLRRTKL
uniref:Protein phosphatase 1d n=3 Tax=Ornithodoros turicata TaxID=34597 RepID=A0A2R5LLJ2_9ACAR